MSRLYKQRPEWGLQVMFILGLMRRCWANLQHFNQIGVSLGDLFYSMPTIITIGVLYR